jgi:hypothetical protein
MLGKDRRQTVQRLALQNGKAPRLQLAVIGHPRGQFQQAHQLGA